MSGDLILADDAEQLPGRIELYMLGKIACARIWAPALDFVTDIQRRTHKAPWTRRPTHKPSKLAQSLDFMEPRRHSYRFNYGRFQFSANGSQWSTCVSNGRGQTLGSRLIIEIGMLEIDWLWKSLNGELEL